MYTFAEGPKHKIHTATVVAIAVLTSTAPLAVIVAWYYISKRRRRRAAETSERSKSSYPFGIIKL